MAQPTIHKARAALFGMVLQVVAAGYFIADAISENGLLHGAGLKPLLVLDLLVAAALLMGIAYAGQAYRATLAAAQRTERTLAMARDALGAMMQQRFAEWGLSRSEADVALFALKGFSPTEIAQYRCSAQGTVRSQLSAVYAKAGVSGQPMLMAMFLADMIDLPEAPAA